MPRAKGGAKTRRRRKKILKKAKGYFGGRRKLYKTAAETVLRAGAFAYSGRQGSLTQLLRSLGSLAPEERPLVGAAANEAKRALEGLLDARLAAASEAERQADRSRRRLDLTLPGRRPPKGSFHPLTRVHDEIVAIFAGLGFSVAEGPEIETDYHNFEALNIPRDHPARDMQDTFYL